jgi:hypothetical protein
MFERRSLHPSHRYNNQWCANLGIVTPDVRQLSKTAGNTRCGHSIRSSSYQLMLGSASNWVSGTDAARQNASVAFSTVPRPCKVATPFHCSHSTGLNPLTNGCKVSAGHTSGVVRRYLQAAAGGVGRCRVRVATMGACFRAGGTCPGTVPGPPRGAGGREGRCGSARRIPTPWKGDASGASHECVQATFRSGARSLSWG